MMFALLLFFSAAICPSLCQVSDEWITVITKEDFGGEVTFKCNTTLPSNQPPAGSTPVRWMLNDLSNEEAGFNSSKYAISTDGEELTIFEVSVEDFGVYHCMLLTPVDDWYLIKLGLNVRGPYYEDIWEKYRMNTIIGISCFFSFLAIAVGIILVYQNRYIEEDDEKNNVIDAFHMPSYNNVAYDTSFEGVSNGGLVAEKETMDDMDTAL